MKNISTTRAKDKAQKVLRDMITISKVCIAVTCGLPGLLHEEDTRCLHREEKNLKVK